MIRAIVHVSLVLYTLVRGWVFPVAVDDYYFHLKIIIYLICLKLGKIKIQGMKIFIYFVAVRNLEHAGILKEITRLSIE